MHELKRIRLLRGLSQADLARDSAVSELTISEIEQGKRPNVRPSTGRKLAGGLGVEVADLYGEQVVSPKAQAQPSRGAAQSPGEREEAVMDMALDALRKQRDMHRQAINRAVASGEGWAQENLQPDIELSARLREIPEHVKDEATKLLAAEVLRLEDQLAAQREFEANRV